MTWDDFKWLIGSIIAILLVSVFLSVLVIQDIKENGGLRQSVVEVGKEVKSIVEEINEEPTE